MKDINGEIRMMSVDEIIPYEQNARDNSEAVDYVANSIKEFGFKNPILIDENNVIIAGHTRLLAAKRLGKEFVPCIVVSDLTEDQVKAYRLADNKTSEFSTWDEDLLGKELLGIEMNMELFGFFPDEEEEKEKKKEVKGELEFTEVLGESHQYLVLFFDNEVDWLQAQTLFDVKPKRCLLTTKGKGKPAERVALGRVLNGAQAIERMRNELGYNG